jgi:hypothetical protein
MEVLMMDRNLQIILFFSTLGFLIYIINMVRNKKLELRYILIWLFTAIGLMIITVLPGAINTLSNFIHIKEPVNTLFLSIIFFMLLIIFSLTKHLSKADSRISTVIQELGITKLAIEDVKKQLEKIKNKD